MTEPMSRLTAALADRYRLERELGAGGMATVYLAHDIKHERDVAIKVLHPDLGAALGGERFLSEIRTTARLQHPHILPLLDSGAADGLLYYVMPLVTGETLRTRLERERQLPIDDAVRIAREVASALDYAHRQGVIHRDIKPENILLHDGQALVADFGIALAVQSAGGTRMTQTGLSLGTPQYMSPEQAMGEKVIDARSDVYALAAVSYEMLAGDPPFAGGSVQAIVAKIMSEKPTALRTLRDTVPEHVEDAVLSGLAKLPADRFATAAAFAAALSSGGTTSSRTALRPEPIQRGRSLIPWGVATVALAIGAWGWLQRAPAPEVRRLAISLSDTLGIFSFAPALDISPDGRQIAFRGEGQNGPIWIKRPGELDPVPIPGTERGASPTFSPDGQWLAFVADGQLKKVRLDGGAAMLLADSVAPIAYGITWLDDNTLVYASPAGDEFRRVGASGGAYTTMLSNTSYRGYGFVSPSPLPKARGVLFTLCTSNCATSSIRAVDFSTGEVKPLVVDAVRAWVLPTGDLMYVRNDGAVLVAPFDIDALEIRGPATLVVERVAMMNVGNSLPLMAWSPTGTLLYFRGDEASGATEIVRVSRAGLTTPIDTSWYIRGFNSLSLSPNGRQLAVGVGPSAGKLNIWVKALDSGPFSRFTFGGDDRRPAWSPDGRTIAFIRDSTGGSAVYTRQANSSADDQQVQVVGRFIQEVTWSGDGQWLVLRTDNGDASLGDLLGVHLAGDPTPVELVATKFRELQPAVSPDNRWLAYASDESGTQEIYVRPFPQTSAGRWQVSNSGGSSPVWSSSTNELFYVKGDGTLAAASYQSTPSFALLGTESLLDVRGMMSDLYHQSFSVSPDAQSFIFARRRVSTANAGVLRAVLVENWFEDLRVQLQR